MADRQSVYSVSVFGSRASEGGQDAAAPSRVQQALVDFIMAFNLDNNYIYRYVTRNMLDITISHSVEIKSAKMC